MARNGSLAMMYRDESGVLISPRPTPISSAYVLLIPRLVFAKWLSTNCAVIGIATSSAAMAEKKQTGGVCLPRINNVVSSGCAWLTFRGNRREKCLRASGLRAVLGPVVFVVPFVVQGTELMPVDIRTDPASHSSTRLLVESEVKPAVNARIIDIVSDFL